MRPQPPPANAELDRFQFTIDEVATTFWTWRSDGDPTATFVDQHSLDLTGRTLPEVVGDGWRESVHPEDRPTLADSYRQAFAARQLFEAEFRLRRGDGAYRWALARGVPRYAASGEFTGYVGSTIDITELRRLAAAVRDSAHRFRRLVENSPDVIYRLRFSPNRIDYVSPSVEALVGYAPAEFYENPSLPLAIVHVEDRPAVEAALAFDVARLRQALLVRWMHRDGRTVWVEHRLVPLRDDDGTLIGLEGVARNATERVEAQQALAESEAKFRLLAEHAQDMVYRHRVYPTVRTEYMSPASLRILGYSPDEFYADPELAFKVVHPDDRAVATRMLEDPADHRDPICLRWFHRNGTEVCVEHRNVPTYDDHGRLIAIEGIGRDVTAMMAVEERLKGSKAQLRELASRLQALREEERTHLARELHDDLGQTLTGIKLDLVRIVAPVADGHPADISEVLKNALAAIDRSTATVSRISGDLRPGALDHLGLAAALEVHAAALSNKTSIRCRVSPVTTELRLDRERSTALFRIAQEALTNVVRHSHASAARIRLTQSARLFKLTVQDNGRGISNEELSDPRSIGLLGMRERAQMVGGRLEITGRPGHGTTLVVTIPTASAERPPQRRQSPQAKSHASRIAG